MTDTAADHPAETEPLIPADPLDPDVALVLAGYHAYADGDIEAAVAGLSSDVEWIEPEAFPLGGRHIGPRAVAEYLTHSAARWAEFHSEPIPYRQGPDIVVLHRVWGTLIDNSTSQARVVDVYRVQHDRVVRMEATTDLARYGLDD